MSDNMWSYYRDRYGTPDALEGYFSSILKESIPLQVAIAQIRNAERAIDSLMEEILD